MACLIIHKKNGSWFDMFNRSSCPWKNCVHRRSDGRERAEETSPNPTCRRFFSSVKSNFVQPRLLCWYHAGRGQEKCFREQTKRTPTVSINYLGSMTSIIQKCFSIYYHSSKMKTEACLKSPKVRHRLEWGEGLSMEACRDTRTRVLL